MNQFEFGSILKDLATQEIERVPALLKLLNKPGNLFLMEWGGQEVPVRGRIGEHVICYIENEEIQDNTGACIAECFRFLKKKGENEHNGVEQGLTHVLIILTTEDVVLNPRSRECKNLTPVRDHIIDYLNRAIANPPPPPAIAQTKLDFSRWRGSKPATLKMDRPTLFIDYYDTSRRPSASVKTRQLASIDN